MASEGDGGTILEGPLSAKNAAMVRAKMPVLKPRPIGLLASAGVGDRLGLATAGQVRAFRKSGSGIMPVFAQQSAREMDRLGRTPQRVLDDATFGCLQAGWDRPVGADADHLKSTDEVDRCLDAGFTSFTLDPGDHVRHLEGEPSDAQLAELPWGELEDTADAMMRRYAGRSIDLGDSVLRIPEGDIRFAAAKYGPAVAHVVSMYRHLMGRAKHPVEVEVSVDETDDVTTLIEHVYLATEMKRLGMEWVSFAPRYVGRFEKGVDYIGDRDELYRSLVQHSNIARAFGPYKISLHSGSDKFSIYDLVVEATGRLVHLKTSGTNYLVALDIAAQFAPELFREVYEVSREAYRGARSSYHVSAQLDRTPDIGEVPDERLPDLVASFDSRQILHVGYGAVLRTEDGTGPSSADAALRELLETRVDEYESLLESHIGRHLAPFSLMETR
ncbi:tagaturonate epimerase family protein [Leifsonia bigeumensis]|uniref:Tagaturonate epimerase family protein n=1 Tax=Leifsonella bigeumensis TaxID=433643 RepID=A0ABP7FIB4_9MICO